LNAGKVLRFASLTLKGKMQDLTPTCSFAHSCFFKQGNTLKHIATEERKCVSLQCLFILVNYPSHFWSPPVVVTAKIRLATIHHFCYWKATAAKAKYRFLLFKKALLVTLFRDYRTYPAYQRWKEALGTENNGRFLTIDDVTLKRCRPAFESRLSHGNG
jgi:hypothetical protein